MSKSLIQDRFGHKLNVVVIGSPFSFKGEIGKFLSKIYGIYDKDKDVKDGFFTVCVGDEINQELLNNSDLARKVAAGHLIDDTTAHGLAMRRYNQGLSEGYHRFYIDGHCRKDTQVPMLKNAGILGEHSLCYIFEATQESCLKRLAYANEKGDRAHRLDNGKLEERRQTYKDNLPGVLRALLDHRIDHEFVDTNGELFEFQERFLNKLTKFCPLPKAPHQEQVKRPQWVYGEPQTPMFA